MAGGDWVEAVEALAAVGVAGAAANACALISKHAARAIPTTKDTDHSEKRRGAVLCLGFTPHRLVHHVYPPADLDGMCQIRAPSYREPADAW